MSEVKHTPGPWWFTDRNDDDDFNIRAPDGDDTPWEVAIVAGDCGYGTSQSKANARLIAAAPDLLEALKLILAEKAPAYHDCIDNGEPECAWCIVSAAIAKATGSQG